MKIGILTLPLHTNYGGILQAYALQTVLERMGHQVEFFQKTHSRPHSLWLLPLVYAKRFIKKCFFDRRTTILAERKYAKATRKTMRFINIKIKSRFIRSFSEIKPSEYGSIIVGSDQIWRRTYYSPQYSNILISIDPENAFLKFTQNWNIQRIAYAPSFGVENWEFSKQETSNISKLLKSFNGVSVREKSGVDNCSKYLKCNAQLVLDPTMLLKRNDYIALTEAICTSDIHRFSHKLFCYILDKNDNKQRIVSDVALLTGYTPLHVTAGINDQNNQYSVEEWLSAFNGAELIITDSFHACVFSIIFNKPFIAIGNEFRGISRFESLLEIFDLKNRLINEASQTYPSFSINNWEHINATLDEWSEKSINFLTKSLN